MVLDEYDTIEAFQNLSPFLVRVGKFRERLAGGIMPLRLAAADFDHQLFDHRAEDPRLIDPMLQLAVRVGRLLMRRELNCFRRNGLCRIRAAEKAELRAGDVPAVLRRDEFAQNLIAETIGGEHGFDRDLLLVNELAIVDVVQRSQPFADAP